MLADYLQLLSKQVIFVRQSVSEALSRPAQVLLSTLYFSGIEFGCMKPVSQTCELTHAMRSMQPKQQIRVQECD